MIPFPLIEIYLFIILLQLAGSAKFSSFKDHSLSTGVAIIKLIEKLKPSAVDWNVAIAEPTSDEVRIVVNTPQIINIHIN